MIFTATRLLFFRRWAILALLLVFLSLLVQPQFVALYHTHHGGDHAHVHAQPQGSPAILHENHHHRHDHHHPHDHHHLHHTHADGPLHIHRQTDHPSPSQSVPAYHSAPVHSNGHWHTSITLHQTTLASAPPSSFGLCLHLLTPEEHPFPAFSPPYYYQPRAPPFSENS